MFAGRGTCKTHKHHKSAVNTLVKRKKNWGQ